jgi:hypothetical protein
MQKAKSKKQKAKMAEKMSKSYHSTLSNPTTLPAT